ncbi:hypothetical protein [Ostreiculturibacter nitratireducens]|uniref:hypothetical protein n=1 Tax=Ostreiculturibacter nitratireducens TaxID=3075226 RepID=UPI0031B5E8C4
MIEKDEKLMTLLDITVARSQVTREVRPVLERLALYFEHHELMNKLDPAGMLRDEIEALLKLMHNEAISMIEREHNAAAFKENYGKLSEDGKDAYWAGPISIETIPKSCLPWFDIIAARQRQLADRR